MKKSDILKIMDVIEDNDIRFIRFQFCDLFGRNRNIAISPAEFERALSEGLPFIAKSVPGYSSNGETELILKPDLTTSMLLPWRPQQGSVTRIICSVLKPDGTVFEGDSREILINILNQAQKQGYEFEFGAKIEFYLFELNEEGNPTTKPIDNGGYFDLAPIDKGENTRREIILTLEEMGFSILSSHHEAGNGQNEIDFRMSDPLTCADNIQTFKTVVKTIAERNGYHASFMPKPLNDEPGSGMHIMITAFKNGKNIFTSKEGSLSKEGRAFAGGILQMLPGITLIANPVVNSYKRLADNFNTQNIYSFEPDNPDALIRVPKTPEENIKLIIRTPDSASNPYLLFSLLISAGLEGIEENINPEEIKIKLPDSLHEAIKEAKENASLPEIIGENIFRDFLKAKENEWNDYITTVHDWEIDKYFKTI